MSKSLNMFNSDEKFVFQKVVHYLVGSMDTKSVSHRGNG